MFPPECLPLSAPRSIAPDECPRRVPPAECRPPSAPSPPITRLEFVKLRRLPPPPRIRKTSPTTPPRIRCPLACHRCPPPPALLRLATGLSLSGEGRSNVTKCTNVKVRCLACLGNLFVKRHSRVKMNTQIFD